MKMDLDRTPPAAEIKAVAKERVSMKSTTECKRRWDMEEPSDENVDPNIRDKGEWSKEATEASAPKKRCSRWDATPADAAIGETPKRPRWDQTPVASNVDVPMMPIIIHDRGKI
jgi:splicing factor 3B subunit 1